jgi:hypothetical protein
MKDTSVTKVTSAFSPQGPGGQKYLASGIHVSMRLWENEEPGKTKAESSRPYETVGYVIKGRAELRIEGQTLILNAGDSWARCRRRQSTLTKFSKRSPQSRRRVRPRKYTIAKSDAL